MTEPKYLYVMTGLLFGTPKGPSRPAVKVGMSVDPVARRAGHYASGFTGANVVAQSRYPFPAGHASNQEQGLLWSLHVYGFKPVRGREFFPANAEETAAEFVSSGVDLVAFKWDFDALTTFSPEGPLSPNLRPAFYEDLASVYTFRCVDQARRETSRPYRDLAAELRESRESGETFPQTASRLRTLADQAREAHEARAIELHRDDVAKRHAGLVKRYGREHAARTFRIKALVAEYERRLVEGDSDTSELLREALG